MPIALQLPVFGYWADAELASITVETVVTDTLALRGTGEVLLNWDTIVVLRKVATPSVGTHVQLVSISIIAVADEIPEFRTHQVCLDTLAVQVAWSAIILGAGLQAAISAIIPCAALAHPGILVACAMTSTLHSVTFPESMGANAEFAG